MSDRTFTDAEWTTECLRRVLCPDGRLVHVPGAITDKRTADGCLADLARYVTQHGFTPPPKPVPVREQIAGSLGSTARMIGYAGYMSDGAGGTQSGAIFYPDPHRVDTGWGPGATTIIRYDYPPDYRFDVRLTSDAHPQEEPDDGDDKPDA